MNEADMLALKILNNGRILYYTVVKLKRGLHNKKS